MDILSKEVQEALREAGITWTQFEVYRLLLENGPMSISEISEITRKDKAVVYKYIEKLLKIGLIDKGLGSPSVYIARPPQVLKELAAAAVTARYYKSMNAISEIANRLARLETSHAKATAGESNYKLIFGRKRLYQELYNLFSRTTSEYRLIMSGNGLLRSIRHGLMDGYLQMMQRGVRVMIISEVNKNNVNEATMLYNLIPFRHQDGLLIRLNIFDQDLLLLGAIQHDEDFSIDRPDDSYILIKDRVLAKGLINLFDIIWKSSEDAGTRLKELRTELR